MIYCASLIDYTYGSPIDTPYFDKRRHVQLNFYYIIGPDTKFTVTCYWKPHGINTIKAITKTGPGLPDSSHALSYISPLYGSYLVYKGINCG